MVEQISPELVLVCPELRSAALASLAGAEVARTEPEPAASPQSPLPVVLQAVVYTVWQMLVSALTALAAVTVVALSVLLIGLVVH